MFRLKAIFYFICCLILVLNSKFLFSQTGDSLTIATQEQKAANYFYTVADSALFYLNLLGKQFTASNNFTKGSEIYIQQASCLSYHYRMQELDLYLASAQNFYDKHAAEIDKNNHYLKFDLYNEWGDYYMRLGDYEKALSTFQELIEAIEKLQERTTKDYNYLIGAYQYLGWIYKYTGQYEESLNHLFKSIAVELENNPDLKNPNRYKINYSRIAQVYQLQGNYKLAKKYFRESLEELESALAAMPEYSAMARNYLINSYNKYALLYQQNNQWDSSAIILKKSIKHHQKNDPMFINTYKHMGVAAMKKSQFAEAEKLFNQALSFIKISVGERKDRQYGEIYTLLGDLYFKQKNYTAAIQSYQKSIVNLVENFNQKETVHNPELKQITSRKDLLSALAGKANALNQLYLQNQETSFLQNAAATYFLAVNLIDSIRLDFNSDMDKAFLAETSYPIYEQALNVAHATQDYNNAFTILEKSKGILLYEAMRKTNLFASSYIPAATLRKEQAFKKELSYLEELLQKEENKVAENQNFIATRNKFHALRNDFYTFEKQLEKDFPDYYNIKHTTAIPDIDWVRAALLTSDKTLIEFFEGDSYLFVFLINKDETKFEKILLNGQLRNQVKAMRSGIYDYHISNSKTDAFYQEKAKQYTDAAWKIYQQILEPVAPSLKQQIVIIPDGILGYVPFDALLTAPTKEASQFKTHAYFWKKHQVSYCYSATLLREMRKNKTNGNGLLAFAPIFPKNDKGQLVNTSRNELNHLFFNQAEVKAISNILESSEAPLVGKDATKEIFFQQAPKKNMLHFATHGVLNDENSDYSFIAFSPEQGSKDKSRLYVRELYNMRLQAALVTLSACETGLGELQRGEGIISMARGFSYAGAQSILTTLWAVNDESTSEIMTGFYKNLKNGLTKDKALYEAKNHFFKEQKDHFDAQPFYWAAYIPIGNMEALYEENYPNYIIIFGLLFITSLFLWKRYYSTKNKT